MALFTVIKIMSIEAGDSVIGRIDYSRWDRFSVPPEGGANKII